MQTTLALAALAAVAYAAPTERSAAPPAGCSPNYSGSFQITAINSTILSRDIHKRACGDAGSLTITLADGQLHDAKGRTGYIASNYQFQFDNPPQPNAVSVGGYSVCNNGSLALGGSNIFYECLSGTFYNLYDRSWAAQCEPILIDVLPCGSGSGSVGQGSDGQVGQGSDGQATGSAIGQISDGQPQAPTPAPISQISDGQPQIPTPVGPAVTQISDGQPQVPTKGPSPLITQISDGQPQAPTAAPGPISQISDGQPQAPTGKPAPISQISDGQPQAPTGSPAPISQISDGQPQAPTGTPAPISQISDGQPQAPAPTAASSAVAAAPSGAAKPTGTGSSPSSSPVSPAPNSGNTLAGGAYLGAAVAGLVAVAFL